MKYILPPAFKHVPSFFHKEFLSFFPPSPSFLFFLFLVLLLIDAIIEGDEDDGNNMDKVMGVLLLIWLQVFQVFGAIMGRRRGNSVGTREAGLCGTEQES